MARHRDKCGVSPNEILLPRASGLCPQTHGLFRDLKLIAIPTRTSMATVSPRPAATGAASRSAPVAGAPLIPAATQTQTSTGDMDVR